jgi:putative transcriptional regulator
MPDRSHFVTKALTYLVATPYLTGSMFERSVILLLDHNAEGAMGLIVSLQTDMPIGDLLPLAKGRTESAYLGGPVDPQVGWCLYEQPTREPGELRLAPDLFVTSSLEVLEKVLVNEGRFMLLLGYAGWGAGQLEEETHIGSWLYLEAGPELALDVPPEERWDHAWTLLGVDPRTLVAGGAQA